jgi:hypothetical protein
VADYELVVSVFAGMKIVFSRELICVIAIAGNKA